MDSLISPDSPAPDFCLPDLQGKWHRLHQAAAPVVILNFWSAECPWSERVDRLLLQDLVEWGVAVAVWTIAANGNEPLELLRQVAAARALPLVLQDAQARVADLYGAQTTPHLFVIDANRRVVYQGAYDDVTFRQRTPTRFYLREAVQDIQNRRAVSPAVTSPYGCTIMRSWEED